MDPENPSHKNVATRPLGTFTSVPGSATPFSSSGPLESLDSTACRPAVSTNSEIMISFSSSALPVAHEGPSFKAVQLGRNYGPGIPPPPFSNASSAAFTGQPQQPFIAQVPPACSSSIGQTVLPPPSSPPTGFFPTSTDAFHGKSQVTSTPVQLQPQSKTTQLSRIDNLRSSVASFFSSWGPKLNPTSTAAESAYPTSNGPLQPSFPTYSSEQGNAVTQSETASVPATSSAYQVGYNLAASTLSGPFILNQRKEVSPPPVAAPLSAYLGNQVQQPSLGPLFGAAQKIIEDFDSLSIGSAPGSIDSGIDFKDLPRPLEGDMELNSFAEMYPMNCNPRYLRLTTYAMPNSQSLVSRWHLTLGAVICPLAEAPVGEEVPIVNFPMTGPIRCRMCRSFVNPYVAFIDGGRKWRCNICPCVNTVPADYFTCLDANGKRMDLAERPELIKGSVDYIASHEYMVRPPMPPVYFFLIDVSIDAVRRSMLEVVAHTIRSCLDTLPGFPRTQIGFITFDSRIHFYNMKSSLIQPQMMVLSDLDDIFVPLPGDVLVNLFDSRTLVDVFLDSLPSMFQHTLDVESAFGPAVKAATMVMSQIGGKLLIFQNTLPSLGVGRLKLRHDDHHVYGTDKEHVVRLPEDPFYGEMAAELSEHQIAVDVYAFSDKYADIASLGTLSKYTGGQIYYYPNFHCACQKEKLRYELRRDLTRETAWEAIMRVRCGRGIRFSTLHGNFMLRSASLLSLPAVDCDKAFAAQFCLEGPLLTSQTVYFQVSLLSLIIERYTTSSGERRVRVHTAAVPVVADLGETYRCADTGAIISLFCRLAIEKTVSHKLEEARSFIQQQIVKAFREYQNLFSVQHRLGGRMFYPKALKYLPLYGLSLCKSTPLRGGYCDAKLDERCAEGSVMMALPIKRLLKLLYPSLFRIDEYLLNESPKVEEFYETCKRLPLSAESLDTRGLYIYDDGFRFVIFFGRMLLPELALNLLGEGFTTDFSKVTSSEQVNETARNLISILEKFRKDNGSCYQLLHLVRQGEQPAEGEFLLTNLTEDRVGGLNGYEDWILKIYQQVQQNF